MQSSLSTSKVVDAASFGSEVSINVENHCPEGNLLHLSFAGESFVFCKSPNHQLTNGYGHDMDFSVEYLESAPIIEKPQPLDGQEFTCEAISYRETSEKPSTDSLTTSLFERSTTALNLVRGVPRVANLDGSSCRCKSERKPCLFVHGVAQPFRGSMSDSFNFWWGDIHEHAPCCTSTKFVHFNTMQNGWTNPEIQRDFCEAALNVSGSKDSTIGKIILVTHSMGNLITAASVATGICNMSSDVTWISAAGPMIGSRSANLFDKECGSKGWIQMITKPLKMLGLCPPTPAFLSLLDYGSSDPKKKEMYDAAVKVRAKYATKVICGTDSYGLNTMFSLAFKIVGNWTDHGGINDGLVSLESCQAGMDLESDLFGRDINSKHYLSAVNHLDAGFRHGDGWWGNDRKPVKWFECAL
jgi:hypothetical protein